MSEGIPLSIPLIVGNEWKYIKECLDTGWVSSVGSYVRRFESELAAYVGAAHAIACVNGTAALQVALQLCDVARDEEVLVPTLTFIAPINAVRYRSAIPVFMDCDQYYNIDVEKISDFVRTETVFKEGSSYNKRTGRRIRALVAVHVFGNAVDMDPLVILCKERNIRLVEDATESLGTIYCSGSIAGKHTGIVGDIGCYSFNGNKIITTGGGGMIVTKNDEYARRARYLTTQAKDDEVRFVHDEVGYNYRLTNIQGAMGVAQLEQLPRYLQTKEENFWTYQQAIKGIPGLHLASVPEYAKNNLWMYALQIDRTIYGRNREELMQFLGANGIQTRPVWYLNHLQKPYKNCQTYKIEKANTLLESTLNIPCSVGLQKSQIESICKCLRDGRLI